MGLQSTENRSYLAAHAGLRRAEVGVPSPQCGAGGGI